jgi:transposase-like protein
MGRKSALTDKQQMEARRRLDEGETIRSIAQKLKVGSATISRVSSKAEQTEGGRPLSHVYIVTAVEYSEIYKIGMTSDVENRVKTMQTGCPYNLFA